MASVELREELSCSVCLNIYTEPVSLRCGHNFCRVCIESVLEVQKDLGGYSCPECREEYAERPRMEKNRKLCNIAKHFLAPQTQLEGSGVACTYCAHAPTLAAKTCLQCETSLCHVHLSIHNSTVDHVLIEPTVSLASRKCQTHNKLLEYHCCEDASCICASCFAVGSHRTHEVETLDGATKKKKEKLRKVLDILTSQVGDIEKQVHKLLDRQANERKKSTDVKKRVASMFEDARKQLDEKEAWVMDVISEQEDKIGSKVSHLIQELETQKESKFEKMRHLEVLCKMADPLIVLQDKKTDGKDFAGLKEPGVAEKAVEEEGSLEMRCEEGLITATLYWVVSDFVSKVEKTFYMPKAVDLLLDSDTAVNNVLISGDQKVASWAADGLNRSVSSKRFVSYCQVFTKNSFSNGRHYWEVDTSKSFYWMVGMAYASIPREGSKSKIGYNKHSWCLNRAQNGYLVIHDSLTTTLNPKSDIRRLGIYLDYNAGYLSFYQLCDSVQLLWTFHSTFTEPLHPAFVVWKDGWIRLNS
ncbi:PREDICTED: E3 ubiquitin/ISG15 ligase TRIM25-like [Nanorana parkeri]|uniref:E3 ubiquitin/ISG15 ligase TRIM25-like n=1 Tax=Nanorana parkeri TaxID=125878 RepID=UPI0008544909|nr:PREDICTED: E3 ubiquitin/ISG15 ligase TRIM25-like [Nanorana parkeri]